MLLSFTIFLTIAFLTFKFMRQGQKKTDPLFEKKVQAINHAKELISARPHVNVLYNKLLEIYNHPEKHDRQERSKVILHLLKEIQDSEIVAAVCALAQLDANRRREKANATKRT